MLLLCTFFLFISLPVEASAFDVNKGGTVLYSKADRDEAITKILISLNGYLSIIRQSLSRYLSMILASFIIIEEWDAIEAYLLAANFQCFADDAYIGPIAYARSIGKDEEFIETLERVMDRVIENQKNQYEVGNALYA